MNTCDFVRKAGEILYGSQYEVKLSRALDTTPLKVHQWVAGYSVPDAVTWDKFYVLLSIQRNKIDLLGDYIKGKTTNTARTWK